MRYYLKSGGNLPQAAIQTEEEDIDPRAKNHQAAVAGADMDNTDLATVAAIVLYVASLGTDSAVIRIQNDSAFVKTPLNTNVDVSTMNATPYLRHEGAPIPLARLTLSSSALNPITVSALGVFTQDLARAAGTGAESPFNSEVRKGHWPNYRSGVY